MKNYNSIISTIKKYGGYVYPPKSISYMFNESAKKKYHIIYAKWVIDPTFNTEKENKEIFKNRNNAIKSIRKMGWTIVTHKSPGPHNRLTLETEIKKRK